MIELRWLKREKVVAFDKHDRPLTSWYESVLQYRDTNFIPDPDWRDVPTVKEEEE